jgi:hypothetical protein
VTDPAAGDDLEVEALLTDHYLASLLAARDRRALDVPADLRLDPDLRSVARRLDAELGRVHPSFHFEERLANQLSERAAAMQQAARAGSPVTEPRLLVIPDVAVQPASVGTGPWARSRLDAQRPLLIGGAITSAAISLAGAYVAWRRGRPVVTPMARAVRAVHPSRAPRGLALTLRGSRSPAHRIGTR